MRKHVTSFHLETYTLVIKTVKASLFIAFKIITYRQTDINIMAGSKNLVVTDVRKDFTIARKGGNVF